MKKRIMSFVMTIVIILCAMPNIVLATEKEVAVKRYTVLVLDTSGETTFVGTNDRYTADTAISHVKEATSQFLKSIGNAKGDNYVAIVSYKDSAEIVSEFTKDIELLKEKVYDITDYGTIRSIAAGLSSANSLLESIDDDNAVKNVILFTTGMTNTGEYSYSGIYDENTIGSRWKRLDNKVKLYAYANSAYEQAAILKNNNVNMYTIGLFQPAEIISEHFTDIADFFKLTVKDLASTEEYYYPVDDPDDLVFILGEVSDELANVVKKITFTYQSGDDYTATCYYTNDYFSESSYEYNPSLATMSISFAMSAFGSSKGGADYSNKSVNARQLLKDIGVPEANIKTNYWFTTEPTTDSIGVVIGNKPIIANGKKYTLIAAAIRGGGYEREWASNFTIGSEGNHTGFNTAKNNVINYMKEYISEQKITGDVKIWITGYSRAAAVANLMGAEIDSGIMLGSNVTYTCADVYTYCFETPAGVSVSQVNNDKKYNNIFNIINSSDPVTYVAPASLGFTRYGIVRYLPSAESTAKYRNLRNKMLKIYNSLANTDKYVVDDFQMKKIELKNLLTDKSQKSVVQDDMKNNMSQRVFLVNYVDIISKEFIKSRSNYVSEYQDEIREICSVMFGCTTAQTEIIIESFMEQAQTNWDDLAVSYIWNAWFNPFGNEDDAFQMISNWLKKAIQDAGITNYDKDAIDRAGKNLADLLLDVVINHPNYSTTAVMNVDGLVEAHYPELCFAWLASMDSYYSQDPNMEFNSGGYRIIRINCEVDIEAFDKDGKKVASIINEQPMTIDDSSYVYGIDEDGQKYIVLPVDMEYRISVRARMNDKVNISIIEYCASIGDYTRNVNYFDIKLNKGECLTGIIPAYSSLELSEDTPNGSTADYILLDPKNNKIYSNSNLLGKSVLDNKFYLDVVSSDTKKGVVVGSGSHLYGSFAQVEAIAMEGHKFIGWYKGENLVSTDEIYRICITENNELIAKFDVKGCPHDTIEVKNAQEPICFQEGYTGDGYCVDCGEQISQGNKIDAMTVHIYSEWRITKVANVSENGIKERVCTVCNRKESEEIIFVDDGINGINEKQDIVEEVSPETGDDNDFILWIVLLLGCSVLIAFILSINVAERE